MCIRDRLKTDANATYDMTVTMRAEDIAPQVSWGTSPGMVTGIDQRVPDPRTITDENQRQATARALEYMGLTPNMPMTDIAIDKVFIGSCTNSVSYTHLRAHETPEHLVCRLLLE